MPFDAGKFLPILQNGEMELQSRVPWSSNNAFLVKLNAGADECLAIYKPARGERPLWDFDAGTLVKREVAAHVVSRMLGFPNIPPTILRDGPYGIGSVQLYIEFEDEQHFFTLRAAHRAAMLPIAAFDALANNTDRKGGHILLGTDGRIWCIDHGLTFHEDYKLRTVVWDFVNQPLPRDLLRALKNFRDCLETADAATRELRELLSRREARALIARADELIATGVYPAPPADWPHIPWPPV